MGVARLPPLMGAARKLRDLRATPVRPVFHEVFLQMRHPPRLINMSKNITRPAAKPKTSGSRKPKVSQSAKPGLPAPHVGRPVRGCMCLLCQEHRRLDRAAARDYVLDLAFKDATIGNLQVSETATDALRAALGADGNDFINVRGL